MSCRIISNSLVGSRVRQGFSFLLRSWSRERKVWITPDWRCWCGRSLNLSLSSSYWTNIKSIWVSTRIVFHKRLGASPTVWMLFSPWPCSNRRFWPDAFWCWSPQFRLWISAPRLSSKQVLHYDESLWPVFWWSTHLASSLSTRQSFCHRTSGFQILYLMFKPFSFWEMRFLLTLSISLRCRDSPLCILSVFHRHWITYRSDTTWRYRCTEVCI